MIRNTILVMSLLLSACAGEPSRVGAEHPVVPVKVVTVVANTIANFERVPGNVHPASDATIEAKISGRVSKLLFKEGDRVEAGQLLMQLDAHEMTAKLDQALAAEKQAKQDFKRFSKMLSSGAVTSQEYDGAVARARVAEAGVAEAKAMVAYSKIEAPFEGIITKKIAEEGDLALPGKPLFMMESHDLYRFEADVPETLISNFSIGAELQVRLAGVDSEFKARVTEVSPTTDSRSRTLHIKLDLPKDSIVRSGQFGYVMVPLKDKPEILIPADAIVERGQLELVYIVKDSRAYMRLVRTGKRSKSEVEILSGLELGELLVVDGSKNLEDEAKVEILS